jgi:hypothetical protein
LQIVAMALIGIANAVPDASMTLKSLWEKGLPGTEIDLPDGFACKDFKVVAALAGGIGGRRYRFLLPSFGVVT